MLFCRQHGHFLVFKAVERCRYLSASVDELSRRILVYAHNGTLAEKSAPIEELAFLHSDSRDNSHCCGLVVYHTDSSFVGDDSGDNFRSRIARDHYHIKTNGAYRCHSLKLFDKQ